MTDPRDLAALARWRLILGDVADPYGLELQDEQQEHLDEVLRFLFEGPDVRRKAGEPGSTVPGRGTARQGRTGRGRRRSRRRTGGSGGGHPLTVPTWIDAVHELFPHSARELLERELVQRRGIRELLESPELLEKIEPNVELVKTLLTHQDLLRPETRVLARKVIEKVVHELREKLRLQVEPAIAGALRRDRHAPRPSFRNLDLRTTVRRNLHHWNAELQKLLVERIWYHAAERHARPWHVVIAVDQSGSMLDSAIFSAVLASIFHALPSMRASLFLFDTEVVDLSEQVGEPVDVLLQVQLGGGTNIAQAVGYAAQLVREPGRTIVVLITDFYEGGDERDLVRRTRELCESGVRVLGLAALGYDARPEFHRSLAERLRRVGMDVLVCTPEHLAETVARILRK